MALVRTLEPEAMDAAQEARDYDAMDHSEINARFCDDLLAVAPEPGRVLDVGTGTARIPIELCRRAADARVEALDLAEHMLALARRNVESAGLRERIHVARVDAKRTGFADGAFETVMSNSVVHHIPDPSDMLREAWRLVARGGWLFVRDLARPESAARLDELVATYAPIPATPDEEPRAMHERQRALFAASLHAALTIDEVRAMVAPFGLGTGAVCTTSDRHWTLVARKN